MAARKPAEETEEAPSRAAGACVLVALGGVPVAVAFAVDEAVGVLLVVVAGAVALWRSASRKGTDLPLPSPTGTPSPHEELPGHGPTAVVHQEGMSIFLRGDPDQDARTHVRVELHDETHP